MCRLLKMNVGVRGGGVVVRIIHKYDCTVRKHGRVRGLGNFTEARGSIYLAQTHVRVSN